MAIDFSNYINTYKGSPVLQQQFPNMNDYLALFGYQGATPSSHKKGGHHYTFNFTTRNYKSKHKSVSTRWRRRFPITTLDPYSRQSTKLDPNSFFGKVANQIGGFTDSVYDKFSQSKLTEALRWRVELNLKCALW